MLYCRWGWVRWPGVHWDTTDGSFLHAHQKLCACVRVMPNPSRKAPCEQSVLTLNQHQTNEITWLLVGGSGRAHLGLRGLYHGWLCYIKAAWKLFVWWKNPLCIPDCFIYSAILLPCFTECQFAPVNLTITLLFPQKSAVSSVPLGDLHIENQLVWKAAGCNGSKWCK